MSLKRASLSIVVLSSLSACADEAPQPRGLEVRVAPLDLPGIGYGCYDLQVTSGSGASAGTVWQKGDPTRTLLGADQTTTPHGAADPAFADSDAICSNVFGNAKGGDITYIGSCDTQADSDGDASNGVQNRVTIWVDGLYAADDSAITDWQDPCPNGCGLEVDCVENSDTLAEFDLTIMRRAQQGFFDVAVNFDDVFCSAKFDTCKDGDPSAPIELLFGDDVGDGPGRDWTGVMGFACTGGPDTTTADLTTTLAYSHVAVTCGQTTFNLPLAGLEGGKHDVEVDFGSGARAVEYALYFGAEQLSCAGQPCNKLYFNIALDLEDLPVGCTLTAEASAESSDNIVFDDGALTGTAKTYPFVQFDAVPLDACVQYPLDGEDSLVRTIYGATPDLIGGYTAQTLCTRYDGGLPVAIEADACLPPRRCIGESVVISSQADVDNYAGCKTVQDVYLDHADAVTSIVWPDLESISGYFYFSNNANVTRVSFPKLKTVGSYVYLDKNPQLVDLDLQSLTTVPGMIYITNHPVLADLGLTAALTSAGSVYLTGNPLTCIPGLAWSSITSSFYGPGPTCLP